MLPSAVRETLCRRGAADRLTRATRLLVSLPDAALDGDAVPGDPRRGEWDWPFRTPSTLGEEPLMVGMALLQLCRVVVAAVVVVVIRIDP